MKLPQLLHSTDPMDERIRHLVEAPVLERGFSTN